MCIHLFYPNPFGIHTVVFPICFAFIAYVIGSMSAVKKQYRLVEERSPYRTAFFRMKLFFLFCIPIVIHKLITIEGMELRSMKKYYF